jgi:hypothetical protein
MNDSKFNISDQDISRLKDGFPEADYCPHKNSPAWLRSLGLICKNDIGVQVLLGSVGVNLNLSSGRQLRLMPEALSAYLAGLTGMVQGNRRKIAIGLPPVGRDLSLFLACTTVLNKIIKRGKNITTKDEGALIISPDIGIRSFYCDLFVKQESLDAAFPGSRLLPSGKIEPLGKSVHKIFSGVCFFLPHRRILPKNISIRPDIIVLDLRYSRLNSKVEGLIKWVTELKPASGILALYTIGDRLSSSLMQETGFIDFPLDHSGIRICKDNLPSVMKTTVNSAIDINVSDACDSLSRQHVLKDVALAPDLSSLMQNLTQLFDEHSKNNHAEINRLRWLFSVYSQLPVPLVWYENRARTMGRWIPKNVIKRIGSNTRDIGNLGPVLQTFRATFTRMDAIYETINPKAQEIKKIILSFADKLSNSHRLLVLVRDEIMESALSSWLSLSEFMGKEWLSHIDIVACKKYVHYANFRYAYFISAGPVHFQFRWILGANLGKILYFIVYPHEIAIVQTQIDQFYNHVYIDQRAEKRVQAINRLGQLEKQMDSKENRYYPELTMVVPQTPVQTIRKKELKQTVHSFEDLWDRFQKEEQEKQQNREERLIEIDEVAERLIEEAAPEYSLDEVDSFARDVEGIKCFEISLSSRERGKGQMWVSEDAYVEYIRPTGAVELSRSGPQTLQVGDLLLIVDEQQQRGIFDRLIEIADNNPRMQYIAVYRNIWRKAIDLLASKYQASNGKIDYPAMYAALKTASIQVATLQTLQNWVNDIVIGPEDVSSLAAVGAVSGISELSQRAQEFDKAFIDIRSLHRRIGRRVAKIIRKTFKVVATEEDIRADDNLQEYLGVPLTEIVNAVEVAEVTKINLSRDGIVPDFVGKFIKVG